MATDSVQKVLDPIRKHEAQILEIWLAEQAASSTRLQQSSDNLEYSRQLLQLLASLPQSDNLGDLNSSAWNSVRELLNRVSISRAEQGFTPTETAMFVFSLKKPLFSALREEYAEDADTLIEAMWTATEITDGLGLYTTEVFQKGRDRVIAQQRREINELSTPVVQLWDEILAVPLIGTLDSARTQTVMENVLNRIMETNSRIIIIDITGVPVVDTLVAQHILKTAQATRLMGAECYISGISPQIAQTIVHLGISLNDLVSRATLKEAFALALKRLSLNIVKGE